MKKLILSIVLLLLLPVVPVLAQQSPTISYQGVISDAAGKPAESGTYSITITFYSDEGGTHPLWQDSFETEVRQGVFNIALGSGQPLPASTDMDRPIWVGTQIGRAAELRPLAKFASVPMAVNAITAQKLSTDYVSSISVNGQKMTGKASSLNITTGDGLNAVYDPGSNSILLSSGAISSPLAKGESPLAHNTGTGVDWWGELGNHGTALGTNYIGNSDNVGLDFRVNNARVMEYLPDATSPDILGGFSGNTIGSFSGSTIAGGGQSGGINDIEANFSFIGGGASNTNKADSAIIVGGSGSTIYPNANNSFIGAGQNNQISGVSAPNGGDHSVIVGGQGNYIKDHHAFIGGGQNNDVTEEYSVIGGGLNDTISGLLSFIGSGDSNSIGSANNEEHSSRNVISGGSHNRILPLMADDSQAGDFIGGGLHNTIYGAVYSSTIGGGVLNLINDSAHFSFIGGGRKNEIDGPYSVIGGGDSNVIWNMYADHNVIGGGQGNVELNPSWGTIGGGGYNLLGETGWGSTIAGGINDSVRYPLGFIGGGWNNNIGEPGVANYGDVIDGGGFNRMDYAAYSSVGGGYYNMIFASYSAIGGGDSNTVHSDKSFIGGGLQNLIDYNATYSAVGGGEADTLSSASGFIGGGLRNRINAASPFSTIAGGDSNTVNSQVGSIGGGDSNTINHKSSYSTIAGGQANTIDTGSSFSTISGGNDNVVTPNAPGGTVGGGSNNLVEEGHGTIAGGEGNIVDSWHGFIGGGWGNKILQFGGDNSSIGGGFDNRIDLPAFGSSIFGGEDNYIGTQFSSIGAGINNIIDTNHGALASTIAGGNNNVIRAEYSSIGGGAYNFIGYYISCDCALIPTAGTIAGGYTDTIEKLDTRWLAHFPEKYYAPIMAAIGGGILNTVNGNYGVVGGGFENHALGIGSAVPGGVGLEALDFQTFVGHFNANVAYALQLTNLQSTSPTSVSALGDKITFGVGNGVDAGHRSNAFELSDNGHSIVHDQLGMTGGGRIPVFGGTYNDNVIYAWGDINSGGSLASDFGVASVVHLGPGTYGITIKNTNATFTNASVTVTIRHNDTTNVNATTFPDFQLKPPGITLDADCGHADATEIGIFIKQNAFVVHTYPLGSCTPQDRPFFFKVCGR